MHKNHLTADERYTISHMTYAKFKPAAIARKLNRHRATIGREIKRNAHPNFENYHYDDANRLAKERRAKANKRYKADDPKLGDYVRQGLGKGHSPEQIVGRLKIDHPRDSKMRLCFETIYQWIYRLGRAGEALYKCLRRRRRHRRLRLPFRGKTGPIADRVSIHDRPAGVETRRRFGHWESDTLQGGQGKGGLATHVERKSRYLIACKVDDGQAQTYCQATIGAMIHLPSKRCLSATCDNGSEFARFKEMQQALGIKVYFADSYSPWQRGANENTNGLLRESYPKGTDFRQVSHEEVAKAVELLNNRPRKCLNYRTPAEVFCL